MASKNIDNKNIILDARPEKAAALILMHFSMI